MVMLGAALLGEPIGYSGWCLALTGFIGVMIILRPSADGIDLWSLSILASTLCMAIRDLATRSQGKQVSSALVAFSGAVGLTSFTLAASFLTGMEWVSLQWDEIADLAGASCAASVGFACSVIVMRLGTIGFVRDPTNSPQP